jgi:hypothetical protein
MMTRGIALRGALQSSHNTVSLPPIHLRIQGASGVTIDPAKATVPGRLPIAVLPLPPAMGSIKVKNGG